MPDHLPAIATAPAPHGAPPPPAPPCDEALQSARTAIATIARTARLSAAGIEALSRWTCWIAYATQQEQDPHQLAWPAWRTVLPVDRCNAEDKLMRVLLRAGEPQRVACEAAELAYRHEGFLRGAMSPAETYAPLLGAGTSRLPAHAATFDALPTWGKEMALYAANLAGKEMVTILDLRGMDLRWLRAFFVDFGGCDVSGCDFSHADLRGASLRHAIKEQARFDHALRDPAPSIHQRRYPRPGHGAADSAERTDSASHHDTSGFLRDNEILEVLPFTHVEQKNGIEVGYIADGKAVVQQHGLRGGTAAIAAMLVADHRRQLDARTLHAWDLGNNNDIRQLIEGADLEAITKGIASIEMLAEQLAKDGPAKVSIADKRLGWHQVIIDNVELATSRAQLRDAFHGWAVIIPLKALTDRLPFPTAIIHAAIRTMPRRRPDPCEIKIWEPDTIFGPRRPGRRAAGAARPQKKPGPR